MANLVQKPVGSASFSSDVPGAEAITYGFLPVSTEWNANSVDKRFFTANRPYRVVGLRATVTVAGTSASAVTAIVRKVPSGTAIGSGTSLHNSSSINLKGTADTVQAPAIVTTDATLNLAVGDSLALDFTGTLTDATGVATVDLEVR